ncbi:hypothetical protein PLICRDRAFT_175717 [Plicaturopsis crispa FD-325 SS-3]|nr:hypothetical protein PLICRDRAFT_175717 [Plicaturopsis crispa FD-325 SS-3]
MLIENASLHSTIVSGARNLDALLETSADALFLENRAGPSKTRAAPMPTHVHHRTHAHSTPRFHTQSHPRKTAHGGSCETTHGGSCETNTRWCMWAPGRAGIPRISPASSVSRAAYNEMNAQMGGPGARAGSGLCVACDVPLDGRTVYSSRSTAVGGLFKVDGGSITTGSITVDIGQQLYHNRQLRSTLPCVPTAACYPIQAIVAPAAAAADCFSHGCGVITIAILQSK